MYQVSDAFLQAVQENTRQYFWTGRITTKRGKVYEFGPEDIVKGSGYISSQCCGSTEIELGTVYASEMGITLLSNIDKYTLEDALVELFYHLMVGEDNFEMVPMGIFEVTEANRTVKCLELKAYDFMLRFEKSFHGFESVGTAYDFIHLCCRECEVEFAQTEDEIRAMPNGSEGLSIYEESDIETYRDVLFYVGQILGGFFCINREGKLELRKYGNVPVMEIAGKHRFSSSFSDFITRYTAVSSTNMRTQIAEYYALDVDDGLTLNLGVNPLLQFGLDVTRRQLCMNILQDLSVVDYVPFDSDTIGNPALDLGDVLRFCGGQADAERISAITAMTCRIGGKHSLKCVGKNPRLSQAKSKNDKNISGLLNEIEKGKMGIHTFTNAVEFEVGETKTLIVSMQFATSEENHVQFLGQVIVDVEADQVKRSAVARGSIRIPGNSNNGDSTGGSVDTGTDTDTGNNTGVDDNISGSDSDNVGVDDTTGNSSGTGSGSGSGLGSGSGSGENPDEIVDSGSGNETGNGNGESLDGTLDGMVDNGTGTDLDGGSSGSIDGAGSTGSTDGTGSADDSVGNTDVVVDVELPVVWMEDGHVDVRFIYVFNDEEVLVHQPQERWCSGRHTILLYYPIEKILSDYTNSFRVYMVVNGGIGRIAVGGCVASVSGQNLGAGAEWDGEIILEDTVGGKFGIGGMSIGVHDFVEHLEALEESLNQNVFADSMGGKILIGAFGRPIEV